MNVDTRVDNIVKAYKSASLAQKRVGAAWYPQAYHDAALLDPVNPSRAVGVIAALSPQTGWKRNLAYASQVVKWADELSEGDRLHRRVDSAPRVHFAIQMAKAISIAAYNVSPLEVLHGPKERAFYGAIMGHPDAVVIDRWAARAADPDRFTGGKNETVTPAQYRKLALAYMAAAHKLNRPVRDVQGTVWFATRTVDV